MKTTMMIKCATVALGALLCSCVNGATNKKTELVITMDYDPKNGRADLDQLGSLQGDGEKDVLCDPGVRQIAGYLRIGDQEKNYFFWFFEARNQDQANKEDVSLTYWATGGPGCAGGIALLHENGPCTPLKDGSDTRLNPYSWNEHSHMLYVDQPAGTGFSYGISDTDEDGVSEDIDTFIVEFLAKYSEYQKNPVFLVGESYGGHYIPSTGHRVWKNNQNRPAGVPHVNLKGIAVGNGLTNPEIQYKYYAEMAYNSSHAPSRVSKDQYKQMLAATPKCIEKIKACNQPGFPYAACVGALAYCNKELVMPYASNGWNQYDMRIKCQVPGLCYDFHDCDVYLNSPRVQRALGVNKKWESCNRHVNQVMAGDWMRDYQNQVPDLLAAGIPVLIYAGDQDFICNWLGNKAWMLDLEWPGKGDFNNAKDTTWMVDGKEAGEYRTAGGFTFLRVAQAGHMVPLDQPKNSLVMFQDFIRGKPV